MISYLKKNKDLFVSIGLSIGVIGVVCLFIWIFTFKPQIPLEYKHALDSLNRANAELAAKQKKLDSTIFMYSKNVDSLNVAIKNLDVKRTEINNYYQVIGEKVGKFTPTQVDSFFKARYNY